MAMVEVDVTYAHVRDSAAWTDRVSTGVTVDDWNGMTDDQMYDVLEKTVAATILRAFPAKARLVGGDG